jgi:hypothetical protein
MNFESELYSLIAKILQERFPATHQQFLTEQESLTRERPASMLSTHPTITRLARAHSLPLDEFLTVISAMRSQPVDAPRDRRQCDRSLNPADALSFDLALPHINSKPLPAQTEIWAHAAQICCLACDATSQILISGADDNDVKLWHLASGTQIADLEVHIRPVTNVAIHPSNRFFMTSSLDGVVKIFSLPECDELSDRGTQRGCWLANFSRTGKYLLMAQTSRFELYTVNQRTGEIRGGLSWEMPSRHAMEALDFSPGDEFLAYSSVDRGLRIQSLETSTSIVKTGPELWDVVVFAHRSATLLLTVASSIGLCVLRYSRDVMFDSEAVLTAEGAGEFARAQFTCDDNRIVAVGCHMIAVFCTRTQRLIATIPEGQWYGNGWIVLPHPCIPTLCAILCMDGRAALWDIERCHLVQTLECTTGNLPTDAVWTLNGESLVIADATGRLLIFGQGGKASSNLRLAIKPRTNFPYERHLHGFFPSSQEPKTRAPSGHRREDKTPAALRRVYMNPPGGPF